MLLTRHVTWTLVPTWLIKEFRTLLSPFVALLISVSFITGCFPAKYKHAVVSPLLKKSDADKNELKNYRPVSNLPCLSKLLEKVAQTQLQRFLTACDKLPIHQSAYRQFHSTETTLLTVFNDLLQAADRGQVSSLCLLELTAAFDTVDHKLLVLRLQCSFGIRGYCADMVHFVLVEQDVLCVPRGVYSHLIYVTCSVPQGSVLSPLMFLLYTAELAELAARYGVTLN